MRISAYKLPLWNGKGERVGYTRVDLEDFHRFGDRIWKLNRGGYADRWDPRVQYRLRLHRVIMGVAIDDERVVDHMNRDRLDNRKANLRVCTRGENQQNCRSHRGSGSQHRGVSWCRNAKRWQAIVVVEKQRNHLGWYVDEEEAAEVARAFRAEHMPYATN